MTHNKWPTVKLGDVASLEFGAPFKSKQFNEERIGLPVARIRDVKRGYSETFYEGPFEEKYLLENGDLLVGMDGEFNIARWQGGKALLNQRVCRIGKHPNPCVLPMYLYYCLPRHLKVIEERKSFVTVKHLSAKDLRSIEIPLPPLEEQRRIARVLGNCSKLHDQISGRKNLLESLFRSTTTSIFGNYSSTRKLEDFATVKTGPFGSMIHQSDYVSPGVPLINPQHIVNNKLSPSAEHQISSAKARTLEQYILRPGDIILGRRGQMGRAALVAMSDCPVICGTGCLIVRPHRIDDSVWLWAYLTGPLATQLLERAAIGATLPNLNSKIVSQLKVPSINSDLKSQIDQLHRTASRLLEKIDKSSVLTTELQASLYARAFNGKL
ncbi:restriction endonuclease subunit S [Corynebacterium pyruviciproducens]|uniref:Restriction endonuclease subunit S n=1 Tax=Corynebacterium pyruviciproducens TaxID=598660 RepID=A0AAF1BWN0_9CORY|nr:restriction endonuclease subunit S [Corynebacterium pyruviciproducens]WOT02016.1 restriction endonuclease subunit S [Corynebacterium pyruviciproducens]